jgi:hypothetical protein
MEEAPSPGLCLYQPSPQSAFRLETKIGVEHTPRLSPRTPGSVTRTPSSDMG